MVFLSADFLTELFVVMLIDFAVSKFSERVGATTRVGDVLD